MIDTNISGHIRKIESDNGYHQLVLDKTQTLGNCRIIVPDRVMRKAGSLRVGAEVMVTLRVLPLTAYSRHTDPRQPMCYQLVASCIHRMVSAD
jgi:hypothetical protein